MGVKLSPRAMLLMLAWPRYVNIHIQIVYILYSARLTSPIYNDPVVSLVPCSEILFRISSSNLPTSCLTHDLEAGAEIVQDRRGENWEPGVSEWRANKTRSFIESYTPTHTGWLNNALTNTV